MKRLLAAAALLFLGLQAAVRLGVRPHAEAWTLWGIDADGSAIWASLGVADTGLLDQQLTTRLLVVPPSGTLIEHRAQWGPTDLDADGVHGADRLEREASGWSLRVGGEGLGARVTVRGGQAGCPPVVGAMGGMIEDRVEGRLLDGHGVVVREALDGHPEGAALYALDPTFSAGIDPFSGCPAWVRDGERVWTGAAVAVPVERRARLALGEWTLTLRGVGDPVIHDEWAHALLPERIGAGLFGFRAPVTELRRVLLDVVGPGGERIVPGIRIERR